jgi:solute carrier family 25 S-adenosylmethionine transporter 26
MFLKSGASAGIGVDIALFPLDTIKTRLQSKEGFLKSGGFRSIYNGLPSTLLGSAPTSALFFTVYDTSKQKLKSSNLLGNSDTLNQIVAANLGETSACLIRVPVDVVKQRAQASHNSSAFSIFKNILLHEVNNSFLLLWVLVEFTKLIYIASFCRV